MIVIGIDPGLSGAIVCRTMNQDGTPGSARIYDMPTIEVQRGGKSKREVNPAMLASVLRSESAGDLASWSPSSASNFMRLHAFVERVGAMPGQGVSSVFSFGRSVGIVEGVLAALSIPMTIVPPQTWQKAVNTRDGKDGSRLRAMELFPHEAAFFERKRDDGRADAALIAYYGCIQLKEIL